MVSDFERLRGHLGEWDRRRRAQEALRLLPRALAVATLPALVLAFVARLQPLLTRTELTLAAAALLALSAALVALVVVLRRRDLIQQARLADRQLGLRERAVTAVELHQGTVQTTPEMAARQVADAVAAAGAVDIERRMPLTVNRREGLVLAALLSLLLAAIWLPNLQEALLRQQRGVADAVAEQSVAVGQAAEAIAADESLTPEQREALSAPLAAAQADLASGELTQEEALATLGAAEDAMRELSAELSADALRRSLESGASALANTEASAALGEALRQGDLAAAAVEASDLAGELSRMDEATHEGLAENLEATAGTVAESDPALAEALQAAAEALNEGDQAAANEALTTAAQRLSERAQQEQAAAAANDAATQLGAARRGVAAAGGAGGQAPAQPGEGSPGDMGALGGSEGQAGQGAAGDGQAPGDGAGQGQAAGQESGGSGDGGAAAGGPSAGGGRAENVFVPSPADLSAFEGSAVQLPAECLADPENCGPLSDEQPADPEREPGGSIVPYTEVYGNYRDAAYEALEGAPIPPGLKSLVRDYFTSLQP